MHLLSSGSWENPVFPSDVPVTDASLIVTCSEEWRHVGHRKLSVLVVKCRVLSAFCF